MGLKEQCCTNGKVLQLTWKIWSDRLDKKGKSFRVKMISGWVALMCESCNPRKHLSDGVRKAFISKNEMPSFFSASLTPSCHPFCLNMLISKIISSFHACTSRKSKQPSRQPTHVNTSQPNTAKQKQDNIFYTVWKTYNSAFPTNQKERNIILEPDIRSTVCKWNN